MKKLVAILIVLSLLFFLYAPAAAATNSWTCGKDAVATLSYEGVLTVSGNGAMEDQLGRFYGGPWSIEVEKIKAIVIEYGITRIGHASFLGCYNLVGVTIASSVTSIGGNAFKGCTSLKSIVLPDSVETIDWCVFQLCSSLKTITIPVSIVSIGSAAFQGCDALTDVYYGGSEAQWNAIEIDEYNEALSTATVHFNYSATASQEVASGNYNNLDWSFSKDGTLSFSGYGKLERPVKFDYYTFYLDYPWDVYKDQIKKIEIGEGITLIGPNSFMEYAVGEVVFPDSLTSIGNYAFYHCPNLSTVAIPQNVVEIGFAAFSGCPSLYEIDVAAGNRSFVSSSGVLFNKGLSRLLCYPCGKAEYTYEIPHGVNQIDAYAFERNLYLTKIIIPEGVTQIESDTFYSCSALAAIYIPISLTTVMDPGFYWCKALRDVYYAGSKTQWEQINIETQGTDPMVGPLFQASVSLHFNTPSEKGSSFQVSVSVNGSQVSRTDAEPFIDENNRTMVPLRAVAEALGLSVSWDGARHEAVFADGNKTLYFPIGSTAARTGDGKSVQMDTAAVIVNDRTYAPIRYLAEYFGYTVGWDGATRTVIIE